MLTISSPNMNLPVPVVGSEAGPQYAVDVNNCFSLLDSHDHSSGYGVSITPSGLNINADLPFGSHNATLLRSVRFDPQLSLIAGSAPDLGCLYVSGVDLYYNDVNGNQIRFTQSGSLAGATGTIAGLVSPASATYVPSSSTFVWQSNANVPAILDSSSIIIRKLSAGSYGTTIAASSSLAADFTITLPAAPPSGTSFVTMDHTGNLGVSIPIASGITGSMIASSVVLAGNPKVNTNYWLTAGHSSGVNSLVTADWFGALGNPQMNTMTAVHGAPGVYTVTFGASYAASPTPAVLASFVSGYVGFITVDNVTNTGCQVKTYNNVATPTDSAFSLVVIGSL